MVGARAEIESAINQIDAEIETLEKRLADLRGAKSALFKLGAVEAGDKAVDKVEERRPTVRNKIIGVLMEIGSAEVGEILKHLQANFRPDLSQATVYGTLQRLKVQELVYKQDGKWHLHKKRAK